jgi:hypothetical protein
VAKWLACRYLEEGVDMPYAYRPLHWEGLGHAFVNIQMYLDYDRTGFDVPIVPVQVNSYGSKIIRNKRAINGAARSRTRSRRRPGAASRWARSRRAFWPTVPGGW